MQMVAEIIVGIACLAVFIFIIPKVWNSNEPIVNNLISALVAAAVIVGIAIMALKFLSEYWYIVALVVGAITYSKTQSKEYSAGAAVACAALLLFVSAATEKEKPQTNQPTQQIIRREENKREEKVDDEYAKYGLRANPSQNPMGWADGSKYGFGKITILEENTLKGMEKKNYTSEEIIKRLKLTRRGQGGVPHGLLNDVIPAGRKLDSDDLRLGWIDIDEEISSVIGKLGEPDKIEEKNGEKIYYYGSQKSPTADMEIYVKNSRVNLIISMKWGITTPRDISARDRNAKAENSTRKAVMSAYGVNYNSTDYEGMELIEYTINSKNGQPCILRFAVNKSDNYIDYISIRHKENQENVTPIKNTSGIESKTLGKNWIKDNSNDIYIQNPSPSEGETISWSGGYIQDGEYKFANGSGTTVWKNKSGEVVQVDEGNFEHGQRQGQFKHQFFPSGNIEYSNWKNGKEIS